ncbi:MAG: hypothetical protein Alpg2KO_13560 [Alphaproteobacteria bacterium]
MIVARLKRGASAIEYGLLLGFVAIAALVTLVSTGDDIAFMFDESALVMSGAPPSSSCTIPGGGFALRNERVNGFSTPIAVEGESCSALSVSSRCISGSFEPEIFASCDCATGTVDINGTCTAAPQPTGFAQSSNGARTFSASWSDSTGFSNCVLQYGSGNSFTTIASVGCTDSGSYTLPSSLDSGWDNIEIRLAANNGALPLTNLGTMGCTPQGTSAVPTPNIDEDCDGVMDNQSTLSERVFSSPRYGSALATNTSTNRTRICRCEFNLNAQVVAHSSSCTTSRRVRSWPRSPSSCNAPGSYNTYFGGSCENVISSLTCRVNGYN